MFDNRSGRGRVIAERNVELGYHRSLSEDGLCVIGRSMAACTDYLARTGVVKL